MSGSRLVGPRVSGDRRRRSDGFASAGSRDAPVRNPETSRAPVARPPGLRRPPTHACAVGWNGSACRALRERSPS